jgi:hypothetical protein
MNGGGAVIAVGYEFNVVDVADFCIAFPCVLFALLLLVLTVFDV